MGNCGHFVLAGIATPMFDYYSRKPNARESPGCENITTIAVSRARRMAAKSGTNIERHRRRCWLRKAEA